MSTIHGTISSTKLVSQSKANKRFSSTKFSLLTTAIVLALGSNGARACYGPDYARVCDGIDGTLETANSPPKAILDDQSVLQITSTGTSSVKVIANHDLTSSATTTLSGGQDRTDAIVALKTSGTGDITIEAKGNITTEGGHKAGGIHALHYGAGDISITASGNIDAKASNISAPTNEESHGIGAAVSSRPGGFVGNGSIVIDYNNDKSTINTMGNNAHALYANVEVGNGNATIKNSGTLNTVGDGSHGILAAAVNGNVDITHSGNISAKGDNSHGITVQGSTTGSSTVKVDGEGYIHAEGVGSSGIHLASGSNVSVDLGAKAHVQGGADNGSSAISSTVGHTLTNEGRISALNDHIVNSNTTEDTVINNHGTMTGYMTFSGTGNVTFNNYSPNTLWIQNFAGGNNSVAVSTFGAAPNSGVFNNAATGAVRLSAATAGLTPSGAPNERIVAGAAQINTLGNVQAQFVDLNLFDNAGLISLSENKLAGDVFIITGGTAADATAGTNGNGQYISNGGSLYLDSVLDDNTLATTISDVLVLDNASTGSGGATKIFIKKAGGLGAVTTGDGIKVVEVLGTSSSDAFSLGKNVLAGLYDYTLQKGATNQNWYLFASKKQINPDVGSYLANQYAATDLFMHSLHERIGEPQYYENHSHEKRSMPGIWLRGTAGRITNEAAEGALRQKSQNTVLHLGGEIADWTSNGDNRYHLGLMAGYGRYETKTISDVTGHKVDSHMDGYGVGAYFTWFSNEESLEGWYTDLWGMYNWFDNKTEGSDKYDSESILGSVEIGYASKVSSLTNYHWMVEPHAQVAYAYYTFDELTDKNGLTVTDSDANGVSSRVGGRTYLRPASTAYSAQPFVEVNWLYNSKRQSMVFNGEKVSNDTPKHQLEAKVGVQGEVTRNLGVYSHVGMKWGKDGYEQAEGQVGVKYRF